MNEIYSWLAGRYESTAHLRAASHGWAWFGSIVLPVCGVPFVALLTLALVASNPGPILQDLMLQVPQWLPAAAYWGTVAGALAYFYAWLLRQSARALERF